MQPYEGCYWQEPEEQLLSKLGSGANGLTSDEAKKRWKEDAPNQLKTAKRHTGLLLFLQQLKNPITLLLLSATVLSFYLGEKADALIILFILLVSAFLGYQQERGAAGALSRLLQLVKIQTNVVRDGNEIKIPQDEIVPGDLIGLAAGQTIPGDCRLLSAKELFVNEASLTGETFPIEKTDATIDKDASLAARTNCVFMGTHVISGTGRAVVVNTGQKTAFGTISQHLRNKTPETEFEHGIRRLGYLLLEVTLLLVMVIFFVNVLLHKPVIDSLLFSLAIAVGLTPQLLPAIISINLSKGATHMARQSVIVKRLSSIENFGSMDVLCADKTGTLTTGKVVLYRAADPLGLQSEAVFRHAYINALFESGFANPIDEAIKEYQPDSPPTGDANSQQPAKAWSDAWEKLDEIPYDFIRRRLGILVKERNSKTSPLLIVKGAFENVLSICNAALGPDGNPIPMASAQTNIRSLYEKYSGEGYRILGIATKELPDNCRSVGRKDESEMTFSGMLLLTDPLKPDIQSTLDMLDGMGVDLKIITGDNALVAAQIAQEAGLKNNRLMTGKELANMSMEALIPVVCSIGIFAAVEPNQKEKILLALKRAGRVTGFLGDGINDAPALHAADVGISVHGAADVAMEAADIVLMGDDLKVLRDGVLEGRKTFANTLKYIFMATSANFGNMFSMAGASLFLSFLPLLPKQVLLTNLLTDIPEMTIATDAVDERMVKKPRRMKLALVGKWMVLFGVISSLFDYATFGILIWGIDASPIQFRTGWFVESVVSAALIVLVVRTSEPFYKNKPGKYLFWSTIAVAIITIAIPFSPLAPWLGFVKLPWKFVGAVGVVVLLYIVTAEAAKRRFYRIRPQ